MKLAVRQTGIVDQAIQGPAPRNRATAASGAGRPGAAAPSTGRRRAVSTTTRCQFAGRSRTAHKFIGVPKARPSWPYRSPIGEQRLRRIGIRQPSGRDRRNSKSARVHPAWPSRRTSQGGGKRRQRLHSYVSERSSPSNVGTLECCRCCGRAWHAATATASRLLPPDPAAP